MKLVTWNCCRGDRASKLEALAKLTPDVAVVLECARSDAPADRGTDVWFGNNPQQGVAVLASNGFQVEALPVTGPASAYTTRISGPTSFNLLAVWAQTTPTYARAVLDALEEHRAFLLERPSVVTGDFNTNTVLSRSVRGGGHADIVRILKQDFGLVSAYHQFFGEDHGRESRPTHYWRWNQASPFHIDYCFVPKTWSDHIRNVLVGTYDEWAKDSDHRPLVVDLADGAVQPIPP